jgi:gas vesicle protein
VDPLTIAACFKAATTAIDLVKQGIKIYKDVRSTAGDVSGVLKDLKEQYHKLVNPSPEQTKQYQEEVKRVQEVAKTHPQDALNDIWDYLGTFIDEYDKLAKAFIEEEANARKLYKGDESLARRALRRIQIRTQLDSMLSEVREMMVYQTPPELSNVYTRWEKAWQEIVQEQNAALADELRKNQIASWRRRRAVNQIKNLATWIGAILFVAIWMWAVLIMIRMSHTYRSLSLYV